MCYLYRLGSQRALWIWRELVCWSAFAIEQGVLWSRASADPLDIPAPTANSRVRRLNPFLVNAVGRAASHGDLGRTGAKVARICKFALNKRGRLQGMARSTANEAIKTRPKRYREHCQAEFHHSQVKILSVSLDASRVSGKDTLYLAVCSTEKSIACWGDPQVAGELRNARLKRR